MSRAGGVDIVEVDPKNNTYTALAGAGLAMSLVGLILLWMRARDLFGGNGLF
jgi:arginase family enzyme